jgi:hypothetical protein
MQYGDHGTVTRLKDVRTLDTVALAQAFIVYLALPEDRRTLVIEERAMQVKAELERRGVR